MTDSDQGQRAVRWYERLARVADLVFLTALWVVAALPVVTAFPATAAVFAVVRKWNRHEEPRVARAFWAGFKDTFWQATALEIVWFSTCFGLLVSYRIMRNMPPPAGLLMGAIPLSGALVVAVASTYLFPLMVHYHLRTTTLIRTSLLLGIGRMRTTLVCWAVITVTAVLAMAMPATLVMSGALAATVVYQLCQRAFDHLDPAAPPTSITADSGIGVA